MFPGEERDMAGKVTTVEIGPDPEKLSLEALKALYEKVYDSEDELGKPDIHYEDYLADLIERKVKGPKVSIYGVRNPLYI
jgi:hypothetical protein